MLWIDTETFSPVPISRGHYRYAEEAEVMLIAWALDDGPVSVHDATTGGEPSAALDAALRDPSVELVAHNAAFDRTLMQRTRWADAIRDPARWHCTMAQALSHGLPGALGDLCDILGVPADKAKDRAGHALVMLFCKPRPEGSAILRATRRTHPTEWARFLEYAALDVEAMRAVHRRLPSWNYPGREHALWCVDQRINDRGVAIDTEFATAAVATVQRAGKRLAARTVQITEGDVQAATQRDALLTHILLQWGVELPDLQAATLERRIGDEALPEEVRELLRIRLQASTTSTSKYRALLDAVSTDGRLRGTLQFCGASRTGRWAGRKFQPQNLPRIPKHLKNEVEPGIAAIRAGAADLVCENVMELASACVRGSIIAPAGRKLVVADLANIEGRMLAWLAGEAWKVKAFADGEDLYVLGYARSFGVAREAVDTDTAAGGTMRLIGKVQELALGYQGAVGAFGSMARLYGVELPEARILEIVRAWRQANAAIVETWYALEDAARRAIRQPGARVECGRLVLRRDGNWLRVRLPSGRCLCYAAPRVEDDGSITHMGVHHYTRKWQRLQTYGGKLVENVTQAAARDVLAHNLPAIEAAGYAVCLTVHDEVITEAPDDARWSAAHLADLLATAPPWAQGLPLAAEGFEAYRYRKG
jgi:DNA polymerase